MSAALQLAKKNWHLILVMLALSAVAFVKAGGTAPQAQNAAPLPAAAQHEARNEPDPVAAQASIDRDQARQAIQENENRLQATKEPLEIAACLNGIGNLYFQRLTDYKSAATYYERVITEHPDAPCLYQAYVQLCLCYEREGDEVKRRDVLRKMMNAFPNDSQEYLYAYNQLYNEMPAQPAATVAPATAAESEEGATPAPESPESPRES